MTEEITIRQAKAEAASTVPSNQQGIAGGARYSAERKPTASWAALPHEAVTKPGYIHEPYSRFHPYSLGNQLLALLQCSERGIEPGPLATLPKTPTNLRPNPERKTDCSSPEPLHSEIPAAQAQERSAPPGVL